MNEANRTPNLVNKEFGDSSGLSRESTFRLEYCRTLLSLFDNSLEMDAGLGVSQALGSFSGNAFSLQYAATSLHLATGFQSRFAGVRASLGGWLDVPLTESLTETITASGQTRSSGLLHTGLPFGLRIEAGLAKPLFPNLPITPALFGEFDFKAYRQPEISPINAASGGLAFRWEFGGTAPPLLPVAADSAPPKKRSLLAQIHFTEHGRRVPSGMAVEIESSDTLFKQYVMLPSRILLSYSGGDSLAIEYLRLSPHAASLFARDSLARLDEAPISLQLLNILALRLKSDPESYLTLVMDHYEERAADSLTRYWVSIFHVSPNQIRRAFITSNERAIRIACYPPSLLDPVVTQWIERSYALGDIGLDHTIDGAGGVKNWKITLTQHGDTLTQFDQSTPLLAPSMVLSGINSRNASEIIARFEGRDSLGSIVSAMDTLRLTIHKADSPTTARPISRGAADDPSYEVPTIIRFVLLPDFSQKKTIERLIDKAKEVQKPYRMQQNINCSLSELGEFSRLRKMVDDCLPLPDNEPNLRPFHPDRSDLLGSRLVITILKQW